MKIKEYQDLYREHKSLANFIIVFGLIFIGWHVFYQNVLEPETTFIRTMGVHVASSSAGFLRLFGVDAGTALHDYKDGTTPTFYNEFTLNGKPAVFIDSGCIGLTLMAIFTGFVLAFPGPWKHKFWYIPSGLLLIYFMNMVRVIALALLRGVVSRDTLEMLHKQVFTGLMWVFIGLLWMLWVNRFSGLFDKTDEEKNKGGLTSAG